MKTAFISTILLTTTSLFSGVLPDYDDRCASMDCHQAELLPGAYLYLPVPKIVHQIWFGNSMALNTKKTHSWEEFCASFGYEYKLWSEAEERFYRENVMLPENYLLFKNLLDQGNFWAASDILRCELLKKFGGIYVDCDFSPPSYEGSLVDISRLFNMNGLTVMTECHGRNIGADSALFACNCFLMAPPNHPVISSMVEQFHANTQNWVKRNGNYDAMFITGPFLLNRVLNGSFNVIPYTCVRQLNMFD